MAGSYFHCGPLDLEITRLGPIRASITLSKGELVVLSGQSGSGKTTLLRAVAGLDKAKCGSRLVQGMDLSHGPLPLWRSLVTLLAQSAPMLPGTVEQNLAFPFSLRNSGHRSFDRGQAESLLRKVGVEAAMDQDASSLSGGERHRVALARGILYDPPVLLADEPLAGVDPDAKEACFQVLKDYVRSRGRAALVVLHDRALARKADRVLLLKDGGLVQE